MKLDSFFVVFLCILLNLYEPYISEEKQKTLGV